MDLTIIIYGVAGLIALADFALAAYFYRKSENFAELSSTRF